MSVKLSLVLIDKICDMYTRRTLLRAFLLWKHNADIDVNYGIANNLLLNERKSKQQLRMEHSCAMAASEARQAQEVAEYKTALSQQQQNLSQMTGACSNLQAERLALRAEIDEISRLEQQRAADTLLAHSHTVEHLESAVASRQVLVQKAESKVCDMEGMNRYANLSFACFCKIILCK